MNTVLTLKGFKRIYDQIELSDFAFVNYLVGENGSGKTSILNAISSFNESGNLRKFFGPDSTMQFIADGKKQFIKWNSTNPNKIDNVGDLHPNIFLVKGKDDEEKGGNGLNGVLNIDSRIGISSSQSLDELNRFLQSVGHSRLKAKKFVDQKDPFNQDNGKLIFQSTEGTMEPRLIADGLRVLFNLEQSFSKWVPELEKTRTVNLVVLEEPERSLHPTFQKKIPLVLDSLRKQLSRETSTRTFFFVSTHSPFVITASSSFDHQRVYPMQNGKLLAINRTNLSWDESNRSQGYEGTECAYVVSKMLGADITDLGYPENYCILEEHSLQIILDLANRKGIIKNFQFISASGINKSLDLSETIYEIEKLNTLIKCNPYYFDKYLLVVDNTRNITGSSFGERVKRISKSLGSRMIELSLSSLEDYYSNIDSEIAMQAHREISQANDDQKGAIKAKYAKIISSKVHNEADFSRLFNHELDSLKKTQN
jgi:hypothetical protein